MILYKQYKVTFVIHRQTTTESQAVGTMANFMVDGLCHFVFFLFFFQIEITKSEKTIVPLCCQYIYSLPPKRNNNTPNCREKTTQQLTTRNLRCVTYEVVVIPAFVSTFRYFDSETTNDCFPIDMLITIIYMPIFYFKCIEYFLTAVLVYLLSNTHVQLIRECFQVTQSLFRSFRCFAPP